MHLLWRLREQPPATKAQAYLFALLSVEVGVFTR